MAWQMDILKQQISSSKPERIYHGETNMESRRMNMGKDWVWRMWREWLNHKIKHVIRLFGAGLLVFGVLYIVKFQTGRNIFDYIPRKFRGEYETYIDVSKFEDNERGYYTEYAGGRYLYFDKRENAIYDYETKEKLINPESKIGSFCANDRYIFFITESKIFQCGFDREVRGMVNIPNDDWLSFAYVDERNLCCYGEKGFYFFSAEDIGEEQEEFNLKENTERKKVGKNESEMEILLKSWKGLLVGIGTEKLEDIKVAYDRGYNRVYVGSHENCLNILLIPQNTGKEVVYRENGCIGIFEGELYFADDKIYYLTEDNQCIGVENSPSYGMSKIQYLSNVRKGSHLIVLGENFYSNMPGGYSNIGSVGEFAGADICVVDLEKKKAVKEYRGNEGQVIYISDSQYATFKDGVIAFYRMEDNGLIRKKKVERFEKRKSYQIEICHDKLFFIDEEGVPEVIDI